LSILRDNVFCLKKFFSDRINKNKGDTSMPYHKLYENGYLENPYGISGEHNVKNTPTVLIHMMMMMMTTVIMYICFSFPTAAIFRAGA
jgi:hypothetical protein